jgi:hypothetical protein
MYHIWLDYYPYNKTLPPRMGSVFVKDISNYKIKTSSYNEMADSFYTNSYPSFEFYDDFNWTMYKCRYQDSIELLKLYTIDFMTKLLNMTSDIGKYEYECPKLYLSDSSYIIIKVQKVIGEFSKFSIEQAPFTLDNILYNFNLYKNDYFYNFRKIVKFYELSELSEDEKAQIKNIGGTIKQ